MTKLNVRALYKNEDVFKKVQSRMVKKIWKGINELISEKKCNKSQNINLYENGQFITNQQQVADNLIAFLQI